MKTLIQGTTFLELTITLLILMILLGFGFTGSQFYYRHQQSLVVSEIRAALYVAKVQALARRDNLILVPLSQPLGWSSGMRLCHDNMKHRCDDPAGEIRQWQWSYPAVEVTWRGFLNDDYLVFSSLPLASAMNGVFQVFVWKQKPVTLIVNRLGRVRQDV